MIGRLGVWGMLGAISMALSVGEARAAGEKPVLRAGASAVKITPSLTRPVYIAGYEKNRLATSVHDDLWARALVLDDGSTRLAVVSCDLVGLSNVRVRKIRERIRSVPPENVLITTTQVHSGPDTLGLWGPGFTRSGVDPVYMARLEDRIVAAVDAAARAVQPVSLSVGATDVPEGLVYNSREPIQDPRLTTLRFTAEDGRTVGTVVHYGAHPEVNKSKALTSDFVHYVREAVEERVGGVALFLNGALGGMVTPKISRPTFEEMRRVGEGVGRAAVQAIETAAPEPSPRLAVRQRRVGLPLENDQFKLLLGAKILEGEMADGKVQTEVWRVDLGGVTWITIPGEILPKTALALKALMPGRHRLVVALGNDELGYILDPADFGKDRFKYERSMSVGKETWPLLLEAARSLIGEAPAPR